MKDEKGHYPGSLAQLGRRGIQQLNPGQKVWCHDYKMFGALSSDVLEAILLGWHDNYENETFQVVVWIPEHLERSQAHMEELKQAVPSVYHEIHLPMVQTLELQFVFLSEEDAQTARRQAAIDEIEQTRVRAEYLGNALKKLDV